MFQPKKPETSFHFQGVYPCPVCRVGQIVNMPLMEAMSCDFCQQIFTVNLEKQTLKMPSRQPPLVWQWNGKNWTEARLEGVELVWGYWLAAAIFVLLPTSLIGLVAYLLSPSASTPLYWMPYVWTGLTFFSHLLIILWLLMEIYQVPLNAYFRGMRQRFHLLVPSFFQSRAR
ncbi:MAG: hypothetical protein VKL59_05785 [Nostocaceae cyanobacterium]|nr:hypothetical protein [Nostocaceae cyanobacterium]